MNGIAQIKETLGQLKQIDDQLATLAALTVKGIKPLSRYEKALDTNAMNLLKGLGLDVETVKRTVRTGKEVQETLFSCLPGYLAAYHKAFQGQPIDKSPETIRFEGFLFGFPPCCVDTFIKSPYIKNDLSSEDQKILFHWACPGCKITPNLLPIYRELHEEIDRL